MSFVARASRTLSVADHVAFDRLADHDSWPAWMPPSFQVVGKTVGALTVGQKLRVRINGGPVPVTIRVAVVRRPSEITWCGGVRGLLWAEHRFLFEPRGDAAVEVASVETWSGVLSSLLRRVVGPRAEEVGRHQLAGLAKGVGQAAE